MARIDSDFRQTFAKMASQAVISRAELASFLSTTEGAISQIEPLGFARHFMDEVLVGYRSVPQP
jgi:hypothetical protein